MVSDGNEVLGDVDSFLLVNCNVSSPHPATHFKLDVVSSCPDRHFDVMAHTLLRAGRARGMVAASLAAGNREEAYNLCQMHYAVAAAAPADHANGGGAVADRAKTDGDGCGGTAASKNALSRFAEEFGLQLPPV